MHTASSNGFQSLIGKDLHGRFMSFKSVTNPLTKRQFNISYWRRHDELAHRVGKDVADVATGRTTILRGINPIDSDGAIRRLN